VYDHVKPPRWADVLEEEPFLAWLSPLGAAVRFSHGAHDLSEVPCEIAVAGLDVAPTPLGHLDAASVRIVRRGDH